MLHEPQCDKLSALIASLAAISSAYAFSPACAGLFKTTEVAMESGPWTLQALNISRFEEGRLLTGKQLRGVFEGTTDGKTAGSAALRFMATLPSSVSARQKAQVWSELTAFIRFHKGFLYVSEMYLVAGDRYLFRGAKGEALFIDRDGRIYRTSMPSLEGQTQWSPDVMDLFPLS